jgi:CHASE2 domain-containing sensor protein
MPPEKSPETYTWLTYAWVFGLSSLGGVVSFIRKVKRGHARAFNFVELAGEIFTSAFAGVLTFYLCEWSGFAPTATAAFVGIAGHMGSRALFQLEGFFQSRFPAPTDKKED